MSDILRMRTLLGQAAGANNNSNGGVSVWRARVLGRIEGVLAAQPDDVVNVVLDAMEQRHKTRNIDELENGMLKRVANTLTDIIITARLALMPPIVATYQVDIRSPKWGDEPAPQGVRRPKS